MEKRKTIWIVNEYNPPIQKRTRQIVLSELLEELGYQVYLVAGSKIHGQNYNLIKNKEKIREIEYDGAHFIVIKTGDYSSNVKRVIISLQFQKRLWTLRNELPRPDVIISDFAGLFGNVFLKWKQKYGTRIIFDILDFWPEAFLDFGFLKHGSLIAKLLFKMEHKSYREADGVIFSVEGGKDYIIEKRWDIEHGGDVLLSKVGYLNNGVDLKNFDYEKTSIIFDDSDLDSESFKVVYLGSIRKANNADLIVDAAKQLNEWRQDNITILVYGDGDYRQRLESKAKDLGLNNIKFKGRISVEYAPNVLSRCDLNIFNFFNIPVCRFGVSPNKLFMYFASGKPVVSTIHPNYDLVERRKCGRVVDNNPQELAEAIVEFSKMPRTEYEQYCSNCREVAEEYDYRNLVKVLVKQIEGDKNDAI